MKGIIYIALLFIFARAWSADQIPDGSFKIMSDRSLYMAGETIRYRLDKTDPDRQEEPELSKVYYMELISPDGTSLSRTKNQIENNGGSGTILIPRDISSGTYYLKGYTRWMRREGPGSYNYLQVTIINAGKKTHLQLDTTEAPSVLLEVPETPQSATEKLKFGLEGSPKRRLPLELKLENEGEALLRLGVSVVRKGMFKNQMQSGPPEEVVSESVADLIPETRGVSLTGKVQFASNGQSAPYALVYISTIGLEKEFRCNYSDSSGRFYFTLPEGRGEREYFISASHPDDVELELFVDQDFCTRPVHLPSLPLDIDSAEVELISSMWMNTQISDQYYRKGSASTAEADTDQEDGSEASLFFYGKPLKIVSFDDFIKLPTLEEYFTELTPEVSVRRSNKKVYLRVNGPNPDLNFYPPLLMIDGVAIFDLDALLAVSPRLVDRFEIVNAPYTRGNVTFGGIINIITKKGDLGFIDLPSSGLLVRYMLLNQEEGLVDGKLPAGSRLPDSRNTFYWNPALMLSPGEQMKLEFSTPDQGGDFEVWIRGFSDQGEYYESSLPFSVE